MKVDYIELTNRIWVFNENQALGLSALSVYFYLLKIASDSDFEKFSISDSKMSLELKMTRKTVKVCKEKLRQFGIITYQSQSGIPSVFQLIFDYPLIFEGIIDSDKNIFKGIKLKSNSKISKKVNAHSKDEIETKKEVFQKSPSSGSDTNLPTIEEFLEYAQSTENYDENLNFEVKVKYENWKNNGWKNNLNRPITDWKSALKNSIPYLKMNGKNIDSGQKIPTIKRIPI